MWSLFEPLHAVTYFSPDAGAPFEAAGLRAPLGAIGPGPVIAAFFGFAPSMVTRALPDIWTRISPAAALSARAAGARAALTGLLPDVDFAAAADLLSAAARSADLHGRVLGAANAYLPEPSDPVERLWHAATVLREHRGDGHVAALLVAGVDGCESLVWRTALEGADLRQSMQSARGWTDDEWEAAGNRLRERGWIASDGSATAAAREAYAEVERLTDQLAARPWERLGAEATQRCAQLLEPLAERALTVVPAGNPIPLRK
jgi:hypothetical protein